MCWKRGSCENADVEVGEKKATGGVWIGTEGFNQSINQLINQFRARHLLLLLLLSTRASSIF